MLSLCSINKTIDITLFILETLTVCDIHFKEITGEFSNTHFSNPLTTYHHKMTSLHINTSTQSGNMIYDLSKHQYSCFLIALQFLLDLIFNIFY